MLGTTEKVLVYYLGLGFAILLGWAACHPERQLDEPQARRYLNRATIASIVGILHPAVALAARDLIGQVGVELPDNSPDLRRRHATATTVANAFTVVSAIPLVVLVVLSVT